MPDTPSLHTALQREREAWQAWATREHTSPPGWYDPAESALHAAQRATDQALAALEERLADADGARRMAEIGADYLARRFREVSAECERYSHCLAMREEAPDA